MEDTWNNKGRAKEIFRWGEKKVLGSYCQPKGRGQQNCLKIRSPDVSLFSRPLKHDIAPGHVK